MAIAQLTSIPTIPTIDYSQLDGESTLRDLDKACREWGFFQLTNHGINERDRHRALTAIRSFFAEPLDAKKRIERTATNPWGFYDSELTKNTPDWKEIFDVGEAELEGPLAGCEPQWPAQPAGFRATMENHRDHCERIARQLLAAIANAMGASSRVMQQAFEPSHTSFLRLNFYPVCPTPEAPAQIDVPTEGHLGINHHTDAGALTVLLQDEVDGLQVFRGGRWHTISPAPDALIINIGDVLQVWSNDRLKAPLHRVLANSLEKRYSAAYFYNPAATATYAPLPGMGDPLYRPISWGAFRNARAAGDYTNAGEEIQVSHFRL